MRALGARTALGAAGLLALGVLVGMSLTGSAPGLRNFVAFEPRGLMAEAPARVTRLELTAEGRRAVFVRQASTGWQPDRPGARQPDPALPARLEAGIDLMHVTAPVRTFSPDEYSWRDLAAFGLDPPRFTVALLAGSRMILRVEFGAWNPMRVAQYVRVRGREQVYLVPRLVGRQWEAIATSALEAVPRPVARDEG